MPFLKSPFLNREIKHAKEKLRGKVFFANPALWDCSAGELECKRTPQDIH